MGERLNRVNKIRHCWTGKILIGCVLTFFWACSHSDVKPVYNPTYISLNGPSYFGIAVIPDSNQLTKEGVALGRMLFYEKKLSINNTVSCGSCHKQAYAFADTAAFSTGVYGRIGKRSSMSLANLAWFNGPLFWDGRSPTIENQVHFPTSDTLEMDQILERAVPKLQATSVYPSLFFYAFGSDTITPSRIAKAIAQFERTLVSSNSRFDKYLSGQYKLTTQEDLGFRRFLTHPEPKLNIRGANCNDCHSGTFFSPTYGFFSNNGLDSVFTDKGRMNVTQSVYDKGKFKVPTLRNIALTAPYMHDGRFKTLEEVLDHYNEHIVNSTTLDPLIPAASNTLNGTKLDLTDDEKAAVLKFLYMLTDSTFISNPSFSDPN